MWDRLKLAASDGIVLGVKYGLAAILILLAVSFLLGDYQIVRGRAQNGQAAYEYLQQVQKAQQPPAK